MPPLVIVLYLLSIDKSRQHRRLPGRARVKGPLYTVEDAADSDQRTKELLFFKFFDRGYYAAQRGLIRLSSILSGEELDAHVVALEDVFEQFKPLLVPAPKGV